MGMLILYGVLAIGVLGAIAAVLKHYNAPKTLEEQRLIEQQRQEAKQKQIEEKTKRLESKRKAIEEKRKAQAERRKRP